MRNLLMGVLAVLLLAVPLIATADDRADLRKKIFLDQKKLVVVENMEFTDEEAVTFWPLYEQYQEKIFTSNKQYGELVAAYATVYNTMTEVEALTLIDDFYRIQGEQLALMKQYADDLKAILPGNKVFRYLQVENKLSAISRFEIAKRIPMAQ